MKRLMLVSTLLLGLAAPSASQERVVVHNAFVTGSQYRQMSEAERWNYAMGLVDGMFLASLFGAPDRLQQPQGRLARLGECLDQGFSNDQLDAILMKFLNGHPERWHEGAHTSMYSALLDTCDLARDQ